MNIAGFRLLFIALLLSLSGGVFGQNTAQPSEQAATAGFTVEEWTEDLDYLIKRLEIMHPNLYGSVSREAFAGYAEKLRMKIAGSTTNEMKSGLG